MNQMPIYYDGSGKLNFETVKSSNTVIIKPDLNGETPKIDVSNKPSYYDGSVPIRRK